jgi:hypothetical protein
MAAFGVHCTEHKNLSSLASISLTMPYYRDSTQPEKWLGDVLLLLQHSPIEIFQLYASVGIENEVSCTRLGFEGLKRLVDEHADTLKRIGIQRIIVPVELVGYASSKCPRLEEIFTTLCNVNRVRFPRHVLHLY